MCGIFLHLSPTETFFEVPADLLLLLTRRGPDHYGMIRSRVGNFHVLCISTVLHLRGDQVFPQPLQKAQQILQWNGEVFGGIPLDEQAGDTPAVFQLLSEHGIQALHKIEGPYALCWIDGDRLYFARDPLGRRSLLYKLDHDCISVSSIYPPGEDGWNEVLCDSIYHFHNGLLELLPRDTRLLRSPSGSLLDLLSESVRRRVLLQHDSSLAILFSGGLDCSLLTMLADRHLPPSAQIDLINVAFAHPRVLDYAACPDRQTGIRSHHLLQDRTQRRLNFIEVNVSLAEYQRAKPHIINLMRPRLTAMDLSIGAALWFASSTPQSTAKVLLSGLGADELFGGYRRHRRCYFSGGWEAVAKELEKELLDLPYRNLGRDDRCLSDHGREVRHPYLEEHFVQAVQAIPVSDRMSFEETVGGDKLLLRRLAMEAGLPEELAMLPKRAIQFGAKSAKIERSHEHGTDELEQ